MDILDKYVATSCGKIINATNKKIMKLTEDSEGYLVVNLSVNGRTKLMKVHRMVMLEFNKEGEKEHVHHLDGDRKNNCLSNLEWLTAEEHGRITNKPKGEDHYNYKPDWHYAINPVVKGSFISACEKHGWNYDDYEEIYAGDNYRTNKKYFYVRRR